MPVPIPILNPASQWQPDLSEYQILYHGCTAEAKIDIEANGIDPSKCEVDTDFGQGFYTTTLERQAKYWAWNKYYLWLYNYPQSTAGNQPVILRFRVRRYSSNARNASQIDHEWGLADLTSLSFVRGAFDNEEYWSFVQHCRQSVPGRKGSPAIINDHKCATGWYNLVKGPVAAFWQQRVEMQDSDQFSFHVGGVDLLNALIVKGKNQGPLGMGDPEYYNWYPVV